VNIITAKGKDCTKGNEPPCIFPLGDDENLIQVSSEPSVQVWEGSKATTPTMSGCFSEENNILNVWKKKPCGETDTCGLKYQCHFAELWERFDPNGGKCLSLDEFECAPANMAGRVLNVCPTNYKCTATIWNGEHFGKCICSNFQCTEAEDECKKKNAEKDETAVAATKVETAENTQDLAEQTMAGNKGAALFGKKMLGQETCILWYSKTVGETCIETRIRGEDELKFTTSTGDGYTNFGCDTTDIGPCEDKYGYKSYISTNTTGSWYLVHYNTNR